MGRLDPLSDTAAADQYIPCPASEKVLDDLEAALDADARFAVLSGPPGLGKTHLMRVLQKRQRGQRTVVYSPFLHFLPDEAELWLRALLRDSGLDAAPSSRGALDEVDSHRSVLIIVDEAHSIPPATAARLAEILDGLPWRATVLLVGIEGPRLDHVLWDLGEPALHIRLDEGIDRATTRAFLDHAIRRWSDESTEPPPYTAADVSALHAEAEGNPRVLKMLMFRTELGRHLPDAHRPLAERVGSRTDHGDEQSDQDVHAEGALSQAAVDSTVPVASGSGNLRRHDAEARSKASRPRPSQRLHVLASSASGHVERIMAWPRATSRRVSLSASRWVERLRVSTRASVRRAFRAISHAWQSMAHLFGGAVGTSRRVVDSRARTLAARLEANLTGKGKQARSVFSRLFERALSPRVLAGVAAVALLVGVASLVRLGAPIVGSSTTPTETRPTSLAPVAAAPPDRPPASASEIATPPAAPAKGPRTNRPEMNASAPAASTTETATLYINAQPWASVRLDGEKIGITPLSHPQTPLGRHELEAEFPDGRVVKRVVEVGPDSRFISLP
jgi:hypothetical protein